MVSPINMSCSPVRLSFAAPGSSPSPGGPRGGRRGRRGRRGAGAQRRGAGWKPSGVFFSQVRMLRVSITGMTNYIGSLDLWDGS